MDIVFQLIIFLLVGVVTGLLSGLLGMGGGLVSIPCMVFVFEYLDIETAVTMQMAIGSSLAAVIFTTFSSARAHNRHKRVRWSIIKKMSISFALGALTGSMLAQNVSSQDLQKIFGVFEVVLGVYFFFMKERLSNPSLPPVPTLLMNLVGYVISTISTFLGVGGSFLSVPVLIHFRLPLKEAIGTSTVFSFILALVASLSFFLPGLLIPPQPHSIGYIYLPAFLPMSIASFFAAPWGSRLIHVVPTDVLKKIFATIIIGAGIAMLWKS